MRFGLTHCNIGTFADPGAATELATLAEQAGVDSLWTVDHIVLPERIATRYPETADGRLPFPRETALAEPLVWLSHVAAVTSSVRLGTAVVVAPQRETLLLAKQTATLDRLASGRLLLGLGVGWMQEEFDAVGATFAGRGSTLDAQIEVLRSVWQGHAECRLGPVLKHPALHAHPTPLRNAVPLHIGGYSRMAANRAAKFGDGFFPGGYPHEDRLEPLIRVAREGAESAGRDGGAIEVTLRWARDLEGLTDVSQLRHAARLGADRVVAPARLFQGPGNADRLRAAVELVATVGRPQPS